MSKVNFYVRSIRSIFPQKCFTESFLVQNCYFGQSRRIALAQQSYRDAFILLSRKIWFARVATISSRVRHKNSPNFCFFIFHFRVTAILALTLLLTIGRISLELSWHCIHYKNLLVTQVMLQVLNLGLHLQLHRKIVELQSLWL